MRMKAAGEDRHVETEADYKPAADILTSCGNNSKARANAWADDLTGRLQRALKGSFTNTPRKSSCSVWRQRTAHDTSCDDDGGWKETSDRLVASAEAIELNPVKTPTSEPNSRHSQAAATRKLVTVVDNLCTYYSKVGVPFSSKDASFYALSLLAWSYGGVMIAVRWMCYSQTG